MKNVDLIEGGGNPSRVVDVEEAIRVCILVLTSVADDGAYEEELKELVAAARGLKHWEMEKTTVLTR